LYGLAGYAVYHLSFNWWALAILVVSVVPFVFSIRGPRRELWLAVSIAGLTVGSVFFFPAGQGIISVNPALAIITSVLYAGFLWIAVGKVLQVSQTKPVNDISVFNRSARRNENARKGRRLGAGSWRVMVGTK